MNIAALIPGTLRFWVVGAALAALVAGAAGATWWVISPRLDLQTERATRAEQDLGSERELTALQARVLEAQQGQFERLAAVELSMQQLGQRIDKNTTTQARALEELKRNDQTIVDYLAQPVPAGLGLLYARPDTTDPGAYIASPTVRPGAVQPAGPPTAAGQ
jgi:hypothetical protein